MKNTVLSAVVLFVTFNCGSAFAAMVTKSNLDSNPAPCLPNFIEESKLETEPLALGAFEKANHFNNQSGK